MERCALLAALLKLSPSRRSSRAARTCTCTPARSGEVRGARWTEIDLPAGVWTIPAVRMKSKREHRIPLCGRAAEILEAAWTLGDGRSPFVFTSQGGKPFSITRLPRLLQNLKIAAVPHGFRRFHGGRLVVTRRQAAMYARRPG